MKCWYLIDTTCDRPPGICEGCQKYEDWKRQRERMITTEELEAMWHDAELCTPNGKEADLVAYFDEHDKETLKCFGLMVWKEWHRRVKE